MMIFVWPDVSKKFVVHRPACMFMGRFLLQAVREIFEKIVKLVAAEEDRGLPSKSTCTLS